MTTMKKLAFLMIMMLSLVACSTTRNAATQKVDAQKVAAQIADSVNARTLKVTFNYVNPMRFPVHYLTTEYSLRIKGDSISSYLPYFGRAYRTDYGSTESPLNFEGLAWNMDISRYKKRGYRFVFEVTNKQQESFVYNLTIFSNGNATLNVNSNDRDPISFDGEVVR